LSGLQRAGKANGTSFNLWGFVLAITKTHRLKSLCGNCKSL